MEKNTVMFKRSASRTQKSKGVVRTKQILQILLLLGICFWLVYQVKYSHDKKKVILDEKDSKIFHREQDDNLGLKFGRKGLHPRVYEKQQKADEEDKVEDEDEENKLEEDEHEEVEESNVGGVQPFQDDVKEADSEEDDVKKAHEEVELEEDEREEEEEEARNDEPENHEKTHEIEVEEEEEGLKELEDREQERPQVEGDDHEEEFIDEEKEKEEETDEKEHEGNSEEVKNKQVEDEDQDRNEISHGVHEAREEHYKGDDASSAVAHGTESDTLTKSSIPINESGTAEIIEKNSGSESLNGSEDHDGATDVEIIKSVDANITELANTSLTDETEMGNATSVNSNTTLSETEEALMYQTSDPELIELSKNHSEDTSFVGPDSSLRLSSNTTGSSKTNTQDEDPGGHNEAGGVETD